MNVLHDPDAKLDRTFDWSGWLRDGDNIVTATVTSDGLTVEDVTHDGTSVTYWVSGGAAGTRVSVVCSVVTAQGRADDRTIRIRVADR